VKKRSIRIMLVHNHPSGDVKPSEADKDITDRLFQVGLILNTPVLDHLIITPTTFMSFSDTGLLDELAKSGKYVPRFKQIEKLRKITEELGVQKGLKKGIEIGMEKGREEGVEEGAESSRYDIAKRLKEKGVPNEIIADTTGLTMAVIKRIKVGK
jgi:DNA repair protein RadC